MALADLVAPYQPSEDFGPELTEWERSDAALTERFWQEFPDGVVPIAHVPTLGPDTLNVYEWATHLIGRYEHARTFDIVRLDELASEWHLLFRTRGMAEVRTFKGAPPGAMHVGAQEAADLARVTREILGLGLSIRAAAHYLGVAPFHVADTYTGLSNVSLDAVLAADCLVADTTLSAPEIAARTGYSSSAVKRLRSARGITLPRGRPKKRPAAAA